MTEWIYLYADESFFDAFKNMNLLMIFSILIIETECSFVSRFPEPMRFTYFTKRHALTAEQVLAETANNQFSNEIIEYKPDLYIA